MNQSVRVVKSVIQNYSPSAEILDALEDFRLMVNDCIQIGIRKKLTSMKSLSTNVYRELSEHNTASYYRLTAISKAAGILRNYRRALSKNSHTKTPYVMRPALVDCYGFRKQGRQFRLTLRAHEYAYVNLNSHTLEAIAGNTLRSVTPTLETLSISYSKDVTEIKAKGIMGVDSNLDNISTASNEGQIEVRLVEGHENQRRLQRGQVASNEK
jgi:hypothetical protein